jgi:D-hydroxyproline dehydrogenase subunit alpha
MSERFDVVVVGAGPAGMAAAVRAAESGLRVTLLDDNPAPGGQIWRKGAVQPEAARKWLAQLEASPVMRLQGWRVIDHPERGVLSAERSDAGLRPQSGSSRAPEYAELHYRKLVLATGARERFLPFPGWTLPNVMGAGGLDAMVRGGLPIDGKRVVVAGTGPLLLAVAAHLAHRGARILAICEQAPMHRLLPFGLHLLAQPGKLVQGIEYSFAARGAHFYTNCWPVAASGKGKLEAVQFFRKGKRWELPCDYLACGYHLVPNLELPAMFGCGIQNGFAAVDRLQQTSVPGVFCAGEPTGIGGVELAILEGEIAGLAATDRADEAEPLIRKRSRGQNFVHALERTFALNPQLRALPSSETLVCRCEDVSFGALRGYASARDAKLHARCGMGPCQGRICGAATEFLFGWASDSMRPPIFPALLSSLSGAGALKRGVDAACFELTNTSNNNQKDKL